MDLTRELPEDRLLTKRFERILLVVYLLTIPLANPWVRGDGVGYYAYARAPLIEHSFDFTHDYQFANDVRCPCRRGRVFRALSVRYGVCYDHLRFSRAVALVSSSSTIR